jgi:hypothetical protein
MNDFFGCYCGWFSDIFRHPNPQLIGGKPGKDSTIYRVSTCFNHSFAGAGNRLAHPLAKSGRKWIATGFLEATRSSEANYRSII